MKSPQLLSSNYSVPAVVENYKELRTLCPPILNRSIKNTVLVLGHTSADDGGGGTFFWAPRRPEMGGELCDDGGINIGSSSHLGIWKRVFSGPLDVRWFGAVGDGNDLNAAVNMRAIQSAIDYCAGRCGGAVLIPAGEFRIAPTIHTDETSGAIISETYLELKSNVDIVGVGRPSLLKVIKDAGAFRAIFASSNDGENSMVENVRLANFHIDTNSQENMSHHFDRTYKDFKAHQFCIVLYHFHNITLEDMWFDYGGTNAVMINNVSEKSIDSQIRVHHCHFEFHKLEDAKGPHTYPDENTGNPINTGIYDNTAAYLKGRNIIATNNRFFVEDKKGICAFGALEIHGGEAVASGNVSTNYAVCVAVVGDKDWSDISNICITGNVAINANCPFMVNPFAADEPSTGLANVTISNNVAKIAQRRWGRYYWGGIAYNSGTGFLHNLTITGNTLWFEEDREPRAIKDPYAPNTLFQQEDTAAINFKLPKTFKNGEFAHSVQGLTISNNNIYNAPCTGIAVGKFAEAKIFGVTISGNTIVNAGWYPGVDDRHRAAIRLYGDFCGGTVVGNTIVDTGLDQFRGCYWLWASGTFHNSVCIASNSACAKTGNYKKEVIES